jgi:hypothetical protein
MAFAQVQAVLRTCHLLEVPVLAHQHHGALG